MRLVNLTGHAVVVVDSGGHRVRIPADGHLRVQSTITNDGFVTVNGSRIPLLRIVEQRLNEPERQPETLFIVSGLVAARAPHRDDFIVVSRMERDFNRVVTGAKAFARIVKEVSSSDKKEKGKGKR